MGGISCRKRCLRKASEQLNECEGSTGMNFAWQALKGAATFATVAIVLCFTSSLPTFADATRIREASDRVLSIGDLHGDYTHACSILKYLGLINDEGHWTGGRTTLIQTGDVVDRGTQSGQIYQLLFRLQDEAKDAGGKVILLLGNHELMNLENDFRYTSAKETLSFLEADPGASGTVARTSVTKSDRAQVFSKTGWVGSGLRERYKTIAVIGVEEGVSKGVLYVHGGLLPTQLTSFQDQDCKEGRCLVDRINNAVHDLLEQSPEAIQAETSNLLGDEGPFWTRRFALGRDEDKLCSELKVTLDTFGVERMVVGHTAQEDGRIHERCGGRFILADTLISEAYTGVSHPSALEISPTGEATALYPLTQERVSLTPIK